MTRADAHASADERAILALQGVVAVHRNTTSWYNNASFALPLAASIVVAAAGAVLRRGDVLAFAGFLAAVTVCMVPVVLVTWRQTATAVVLTEREIVSFHRGRVLKAILWSTVSAVERRETQGNVRWLVRGAHDATLALDGELEDLPGLIERTRRLSGLRAERERPPE